MNDKHSITLGIMAIGIVVVIIVLATAIYKLEVPAASERNTVSVSGSSTMTVNPDQAELWVAVTNSADTAEQASSDNSKSVNSVMDALINAGVDKSDIETTSYNVYPRQKWDSDAEEYVTTGYEARHMLKVETDLIESVGSLIDTAISAGANNVNRVDFSLSDKAKEDYKIQVLEKAIANAREKAESLAKSLNKRLGTVVSVSESGSYPTPYYARAEMAMDEAGGVPTQIAPQDIDYSASVAVVFEIN